MQGKFAGKTLLVLGSNVGSNDIVKYAKENGAEVLVADYFSPERSSAKRIADEHFLISTGDLESLEKLIQERKIHGVLAGIHEFNLLSAMELSQRLGLPFYCTRRQWDLIENKGEFRKMCEKHNVPHPQTYHTGGKVSPETWEIIQYPAVIKPVDASSSMGVFICETEVEMKSHVEDARKESAIGEIIIEECVCGDEFTAHYTIANGRVSLASVDNRYPVALKEGATTIPIARVYPCLYLDEFMRQVNPSMLVLCADLELTDAILFIQGIYNSEKNSFYVFEGGLRSAGEAPFRFISKINGINAMYVLVDHALSTPSDFASEKEDPTMQGKCCGVISFVTTGGKVGTIEGLEEAVEATASVIEYESRYPVGSETPCGNTLHQLMIRFVMICDSREQMKNDIAYLNEHITVLDEHGNNMVLKMEPERLFGTK